MSELYNLQAEQSVLGGLMIKNEAFDEIADKVAVEDFYHRQHREIFEAICSLDAARQPFDLVTLSEYFAKGDGDIDLAHLGAMAKDTPSAANIEAYAAIVHDYGLKRRLVAESVAISESAHSGRDSEELLTDAQNRLGELADAGITSGLADPKKVMHTVITELDRRFESGGEIHGMPTGFVDFDRQTSGLHPANLIIVAGRPSMGKSTFVENICEHVAIKERGVVLVHSLEMPSEMWMERSTSALSGVYSTKLRKGDLEDSDWHAVTRAAGDLANSSIMIDDTPAVNIQRIRSNARKVKRKHGRIDLVIVDYMQLMTGPGDNREREIAGISSGLKNLAKEMRCPVIALSQLNRSLEQRANKRPIMADLRESGSIEQDADLICFLYRDEVYNTESPDAGMAEVIIAKQRNGPTGTIRLAFQGECFRFKNYTHGGYE